MHSIIRILVFAKNKDAALDKAESILERLCGDDKPFDYYTLFRKNDNSPVSGKSRWGNLPAAARADSPKGKRLIDEGMKFTRDSFMRNLKTIREGLANFSDDELFEEKLNPQAITQREFDIATGQMSHRWQYDPQMIKHYMYCCGRYEGPDIFLYDQDGVGIRTPSHLNDVLNKWRSLYGDLSDEDAKHLSSFDWEKNRKRVNPYKDLVLWVVPADVHF
jgi:hypothetical protein